ncbi:hypothetical protein DM860_014752 [Cuscuta australis]|uniref:F-box protein At3g26010-like beta-propeller domain-containing protein n=1 Tax=Cuscuta australis TaxID=267555 RepID=A0A328D0F8_9ASTE|nr:hypothetical protein DM860_014752 [Cuscuta australis]
MSYRVVRIHHDLESYTAISFVAEVFSSETNKWEEVEVRHPNSSPFRFDFENKSYATNNLLCWNGLLLFENWTDDDSIVAYNPFEPARCRVIEQPPRYRLGQYCRSFLSFGECNGSFRVVQHYDHPGGRQGVFMTWELEDYETEEWRFVNQLVFRDFITDDAPLPLQCEMNSDDESDFDDYAVLGYIEVQRIRLLTMDPNDEYVIYFYHSAEKVGDRRIFACNLETKEVRVFDKNIIERCVEIQYRLRNVFQFVVPEWPTPIPGAPTQCT